MGLESRGLARVGTSATNAVATLARDLQASGRDIISLATGEPDFDTPQHIRDAAMRAMNAGMTRYTDVDGIPELKEAISAKFRRDNSLCYRPAEINVSPGAKAVIFNALTATLNPGDEVIVPAPFWVSHWDIVLLAGATPRALPTDMESGFKLRPDALDAAITSRTRWLILNSPSNPSGAVYSRGELQAIAEVLLRHPHVWILSDDIYEHILFDGTEFATIAEIEPRLFGRTLTVNGVSKAYAMTGWRIGFAGGPECLIKLMAKVMSQSTSNPSSISQWATVEALSGPQDCLKSNAALYEARRDLVVSMINRTPGLRCGTPHGAFYIYASCENLLGRRSPSGKVIENDEDFCLELLAAEGVAVVHGAAFGLSRFFRLSFATADDILEDGCRRIQRFCDRLMHP